jgi:DNA-binding IclR family transcriptional regulator
MVMSKSYENRSLERAFRVLSVFNETTARLNATQIAREVGLTLGSLYPTLYNLVKHGYLARDEDKKYSLGLRFLERANVILRQAELRGSAAEIVRQLSVAYAVTTHFSAWYGREVMHVYVEGAYSSVIVMESIGQRLPAYCCAVGKVLLAHLGPEALESYLDAVPLAAMTQSTITDPKVLRKELLSIRRQGFAVDSGEFHEDVRCVAAPVRNYRDEVFAAISMSFSKSRFEAWGLERLSDAVAQAAQSASARFGFRVRGDEGGARASS